MSGVNGRGARARHPRTGKWLFIPGFLLGMIAGSALSNRAGQSEWQPAAHHHAEHSAGDAQAGTAVESSMDEVLQIARNALAHLQEHLDDYTATLVKQETAGGVLGEPNQMAIKVQCRHRGANRDESQPFRVYLRFEQPRSIAGREVIWGEDLNEGKIVVHEGGLLGLVTVRLDPTGIIAMRGQRYPIYEIGLTNLVKKLIEKGEKDRDNPDVSVTITRNWKFNDRVCDLIVVKRRKPNGAVDDFSRAEICFDRERHLPLQYLAYGWPEGPLESADLDSAPLLESYTYLDVKTNVGLTESDFDYRNPGYQFR